MKPTNTQAAIARCEKSTVMMVLTQPFFSNLLLSLTRHYTDAVPTMATDGVKLFINPSFAAELSDAEILGVFVHEAMHAGFAHPYTRGDRDPVRANMAMDYVINLEIKDFIEGSGSSAIALPKGALIDEKYRGYCWQQVYNMLPESEVQKMKDAMGQGKGGLVGDVMDGDLPTNPETGKPYTAEEMQAVWKGRLVQSAQAARMQGKLPAGMARLVGEHINPRVPWRSVLRRFLTDTIKSDYDWMRPDRRYMSEGFIIPDIGDDESAGEIVWVQDTSGSVDDEILGAFVSEFKALHKDIKPTKLHVIYCDAAVHRHDTFDPDDEIVIDNAPGGGGTDFAPAFDFIEKQGIAPKAVVFFTDLYGSHWHKTPDYPVLWACWTNETNIPFGELMPVDL